ncbi:unnamed protein product [Pipistrellus nathusii]|uniref:Uncharacterized protein n=1 Tax=Pipistrellus nathusii TaxID=59473 RepID=A0ABP0ABM1_PIPNA
MKMSSKYDQSGTEPSFLPPQGLSRSSKPRGKRGCVSLPMPHAVSRGSPTIPSQSHFQKTFLLVYFFKWAFARRVIFLTLLYHTLATSLHLEGLDVANSLLKG